jgi:glycerophosphoryl diester phosphodiesterase
MKTLFLYSYLLALFTSSVVATEMNDQKKLVIAHRGASGYLPEHSIAAKAMAYAMGADYIEQDVVMSKDDQLLILHDHFLDRVTNVAELFPERMRENNRYYAIDFTLAEIKSLSMTEGFTLENRQPAAIFPERFPLWKSTFKVHTLAEEIELIQGLNKSTGKDVGIYPEIKSPAFHLHQGKDISKAVLKELRRYGYTQKDSKAFVQSFDPIELQRIKQKLLPELNMQVKLVQLIAMTSWQETPIFQQGISTNYNYDWMLKAEAMVEIASYADGIGPWKNMLINGENVTKKKRSNGLLEAAHKAGLFVHPYTFRADSGRIPEFAEDFTALLQIYYFDIGVDAVFTDFPDKVVSFLNKSSLP